MATSELRVVGRAGLRDVIEDVVGLYRDAFSVAPFYESDEVVEWFRTNLPRLCGQPGARLVVVGTRGFALGYPLPHELRLKLSELSPSMPPWFRDAYLVQELVVAQGSRRKRLGSRLLDALLDGQTEATAVLTTNALAVEARAFYESQGWQELASYGEPVPQVVYGRELGPAPVTDA